MPFFGAVEIGWPPAVDLSSIAGEGVSAESSNAAGSKITRASGAESKAESQAAEVENAPFVLNLVLPVVPARLVKRIVKGDFVDIAEILCDNLEAEKRRAQVELEPGKSNSQAQARREIPDLTSWVQCFALYASVIQANFPDKGRDLWAYLGVIASEYRRVGGSGWRLYDVAFRQQFVSMESADFGKVDTTLFATTFLTYRRSEHSCVGCLPAGHDSCEHSSGRRHV